MSTMMYKAQSALDEARESMLRYNSQAPKVISNGREFHSNASNALKDNIPGDLVSHLASYGADNKLKDFLNGIEKVPNEVDDVSQRSLYSFLHIEYTQLSKKPWPVSAQDNKSFDAIRRVAKGITKEVDKDNSFLFLFDGKLEKWENKLCGILNKLAKARLTKTQSRVPVVCDELCRFVASLDVPVHAWKPRPQDEPEYRDCFDVFPGAVEGPPDQSLGMVGEQEVDTGSPSTAKP
ncbi:hypothetical protein B0T19DRAFT_474742 [Cercophora scortea]|uniref:Uncharacterized protein n=1 Tax=Cercophora scortea TaxID=314031 RepID=A0AAE0MJ81_9PEZI|nr:hypothetical protein B0T19DRAFT_474742 [Cercophora scortea]